MKTSRYTEPQILSILRQAEGGRPSQTKLKRFYEDFEYQAASWD
jgi:hypothetical protein